MSSEQGGIPRPQMRRELPATIFVCGNTDREVVTCFDGLPLAQTPLKMFR
jgi:hypothetical protein